MNGISLEVMAEILPRMLYAAWVTVEICALTIVFSVILGFLLATVRLLGSRFFSIMVLCFVEFTRGVPQLVQIALIYFALPRLGLFLNEFWTGVTALTFIGAGYAVEIIRGSVQSLDQGQRENALALGLGETQTLFLVLYPQAIRRILPPLTNELANVIKASALLSVISVNELMHVSHAIIFEEFIVYEVLIQLTLLYVLIIGCVVALSRYLEERVAA